MLPAISANALAVSDADAALVELGRELATLGYSFVTPTPESHAAVLARAQCAQSVRDVFGWNRPFSTDALAPALLELARRAGVLEAHGPRLRATVRFSTLEERLFPCFSGPTPIDSAPLFAAPSSSASVWSTLGVAAAPGV
jgi:hypothetical protein